MRRRRRRSAVRRAWLYCLLLALPALLFAGILLYQQPHRPCARAASRRLACCFISLLVAAALIEGLVRPLQTLSNVVSSLREGDYSFRARGAGIARCIRRAGRRGQCARRSACRSSACARSRPRRCWPAFLKSCTRRCSPLTAKTLLQLVNNAGVKLLGLPHARCFGHTARELGLEELLAAPDQTIHSFGAQSRRAGCCARRSSARTARRTRCCCWPMSACRCRKKSRSPGSADPRAGPRAFELACAHQVHRRQPAGARRQHAGRRRHAARFSPRPGRGREPRRRACIASCSPIGCSPSCRRRSSGRFRSGRCWSASCCSNSACRFSLNPAPPSRSTPIPISWSRCSSTCWPTPSMPRWPTAAQPVRVSWQLADTSLLGHH